MPSFDGDRGVAGALFGNPRMDPAQTPGPPTCGGGPSASASAARSGAPAKEDLAYGIGSEPRAVELV